MKVVYPEDYTDEDKAIYDDLMNRGEMLIGKKISKNDSFILDMAAKITINQMKGYKSGLTKEEIDDLKAIHRESALQSEFKTPPELYYDGLMKNDEGETVEHPLSKTAENYYEEYQKENMIEKHSNEDVVITEIEDKMATIKVS
tara:strand:- start:1071 stop:1502 length:432 start_codon:yes stop_codon:yes gene_type:complete